MTKFANPIKQWIENHDSMIHRDWFTFLRFRTISTDPQFSQELERCAVWLREWLLPVFDSVELIPLEGHPPLVFAQDLSAGPGRPTVLIYGHYDVQPVDPIELWDTPPFEPTEKNGEIYARGAQDDKGQIFYVLAAMRALKEIHSSFPVNIKLCIEGQEECGSKGFAQALPQLKKKLQADGLLVVDFDITDPQVPSINLGARGIVTFDLTLRGSKSDLHSGGFGGIAYNPNRALAELLASCWDSEGRVVIPGFYDDVHVMSAEEKRDLIPLTEDFLKEFALQPRGGEKNLSLQERNWLRPTLEVNGISGGYAGEGFKTVIPAEARAKISCRLVPNQDPYKIAKQVIHFFKEKAHPAFEVKIKSHGYGKPYRGQANSFLAKAVANAYTELFQKTCRYTLTGGSIPVIADLAAMLGAEVVGMGYGLATDNIHAPNEHFGIDRFKKGIWTVARAIELIE